MYLSIDDKQKLSILWRANSACLGAEGLSPDSPGHRPGKRARLKSNRHLIAGPTGRNNRRVAAHWALQSGVFHPVPRAAPWAIGSRAFGPQAGDVVDIAISTIVQMFSYLSIDVSKNSAGAAWRVPRPPLWVGVLLRRVARPRKAVGLAPTNPKS